jgi:hypothetical protein
MDRIISTLDKLSLDDRNAEVTRPTESKPTNQKFPVEPTRVFVDSQPGMPYSESATRREEKMSKTHITSGRREDEGLARSSPDSPKASKQKGLSRFPQERLNDEGKETEEIAVARYCLRGRVHIIYRHGPYQRCKYRMEKTEIRDINQVKHIQPVCSNIGSILDIREKSNLLRRRYNLGKIESIVGVAILIKNNTEASEPQITEKDLKKNPMCALVKWTDIEEHVHLFCGKESWMPGSALSKMATAKEKSKVTAMILDAYKSQLTEYEKWMKEVNAQKQSSPLNTCSDTQPECNTKKRGKSYNVDEELMLMGLFLPKPQCDMTDTANPETIKESETDYQIAQRAIMDLATNQTFGYGPYLEIMKLSQGVNNELQARYPKVYNYRMDEIVATWPNYKNDMIASGFQEVGASPDEKTIICAKERVIVHRKHLGGI